MIGRRADDRQAERDVYAGVEGEHLQRAESLVVIHGHDRIELPFERLVKNDIGGHGSGHVEPRFRGLADGGFDDGDFLAADLPAVAGMRIEAAHGDAVFADSEPGQRFAGDQDGFKESRGRQFPGNGGQGDMPCCEGDSEAASEEHHGEPLHAAERGEHLRMAGEIDTGLLESYLGNRRGDHRVETAGAAGQHGHADPLRCRDGGVLLDPSRLPDRLMLRCGIPDEDLLAARGLVRVPQRGKGESEFGRLPSGRGGGAHEDDLHIRRPVSGQGRPQGHFRADAVDVTQRDADSNRCSHRALPKCY